jgi:glycosyltransferase involved in cell wall biosynthesis
MIDSSPFLEHAAYVIMGYARNPAYLESLKARAAALGQLDRTVYFRDAVPIDRVVEYLGSADLGIVPTQNVCLSYYFESSNKIFHCLMAGVPLVMSDHIEKRTLVERYGIGILFDEADPRDIARAVNGVLADGASYGRMRRNCLAAARELNWEHEERHLRLIYADLLGPRAAPVPDAVIPPINPHDEGAFAFASEGACAGAP